MSDSRAYVSAYHKTHSALEKDVRPVSLIDQTGNAIVERDKIDVRPPAVPAPQSDTILQLVERAAMNPAVDLDKMERLLQMRRDVLADQAQVEFNKAMALAQAEMSPISADAHNPQTKSKYASYAKLDRALRPVYSKHGFSLSFDEADSPKPEHVRVICHVAHIAGHTRVYHRDMPADGKGAKGGDVMTKTHATGAAQSYGMRYLLRGIFNVAVGEEDRDGNEPSHAGGSDAIGEKQAAILNKMLDDSGSDKRAFCNFFGIEGVALLPANRYREAHTLCTRKLAQAIAKRQQAEEQP
jgi:hypothetical protein